MPLNGRPSVADAMSRVKDRKVSPDSILRLDSSPILDTSSLADAIKFPILF